MASGTVHWVGAGLSTGSGLNRLCEHADHLVLWNRDVARAERLLVRRDLSERVDCRPFSLETLKEAVQPGDVVVSMLPAIQHDAVMDVCIDRRAHFACTSYISDAMRARQATLSRLGLIALAEAGLDPGLDHLLAQELVGRARSSVKTAQAVASFRSYCGGLPREPNEFCYRFSWAPLGVLLALRAPARFIEGFEVRQAAHPWKEARRYERDDDAFEVYPNRDSLPYVSDYEFPSAWQVKDFVRGTLRLAGWSRAWQDIFDAVETADDAELRRLSVHLADTYPMTERDRDRVVLKVELEVTSKQGVAWDGAASVDVSGDERESAMARYVSTPLACGVVDILDGYTSPGLQQAAGGAEAAARWLQRLEQWGLRFSFAERVSA